MKRFGLLWLFAVLGAAGCNGSSSSVAGAPPTTRPAHSIRHIVILLQENRSFNNLFMGFPGAETATTGRCKGSRYCPKSGIVTIRPVTLESTNVLSLGQDISHSHAAFELECDPDPSNICQMDGFGSMDHSVGLGGPAAKLYPYRAVKRSETKAYWDFASQYTIADHMFFTATASSFIAHQQIIAGTTRLNADESLTDQPTNAPWGCDAPKYTVTAIIKKNGHVLENGGPFPCFTQYRTMADLLEARSVPWKYYVDYYNQGRSKWGKYYEFSGTVWNAFDAIRKVRYSPAWRTNVTFPNTNVFADVKNGTLPAVSWVIPTLAASDHPASGCNHGPHWVTSVIDAIGTSKYWSDTAVILLWDDWGGWYDPVPPPQTTYTSLGFRVPMVVISPYVKPHSVAHTQYDFGSVLKFIEQTFDLGSLGTSDVGANSMSDMFDLAQPPIVFRREPLPPNRRCPLPSGEGAPSMQEIIEHDHGIPE